MALGAVADRVRHRDWATVLIEVGVVIAGVFIGLQASNWNDERREHARGREYLLRLHDELLQDVKTLDSIGRFWTLVGGHGTAALAYAEDGELSQGSAWKTLLAYYQASQVWPYRKPDVTFQEIRSTGGLLLIRDAALRAKIARHYGAAAGSQVAEVLGLIPRYREHVRGLVPWRIQRYIWTNCYVSVESEQQLKDCSSPVSEAEALALLQQMRSSSALTQELRFWRVNVDNGLVLMRSIQAQASDLAREVLEASSRN